MGPTGKVDTQSVVKGGPAGGQRTAYRAPRALDHLRRPKEADQALLSGGQAAGHEPVEVTCRVDRQQDLVIGGWRNVQLSRGDDRLADQPRSKTRVLGQRETVAGGEG